MRGETFQYGAHFVMVKKRMRDAKASLARVFQKALDAAADLVWLRDPVTGTVLEVNEATTKALQCSREEIVGHDLGNFTADLDAEAYARYQKEIEAGRTAIIAATIVGKSGRRIRLECRSSLIPYGGGKAVFCIARDIGETLKEERSRALLQEAVKRSNDVVIFYDPNEIITEVNDAFEKHYGYSRKEVVGRSSDILHSRHTTPEVHRGRWAALRDPARGYWRGEVINKAKDGREIPVMLSITTVRKDAGEIVGFVANAVDISEFKALQERLAQAQSLAAVGEMAAMVSHEIRNPLSSIILAAKRVAEDDLPADERDAALKVLLSQSGRLNETLSHFLTYVRPREIKLSRANLNAIVGEIADLMRADRDVVGRIRFAVAVDPALSPFYMDADQMRQVLWNIALNAVQAMGGEGELKMVVGRHGGQAFVVISDTGPGIAPERLKSIFNPFMTTKAKGTGLGLAICDRIVKAHGGRIEVSSREGAGATFSIFLPCRLQMSA